MTFFTISWDVHMLNSIIFLECLQTPVKPITLVCAFDILKKKQTAKSIKHIP